jgi:cyclophilin family peptidyl-prolyl cis-trans isomerase
MKLFRHFSLLLAALMGLATVVSAQEAPAVAPVVEEAPASLESAPSEAPALDSVAPASLPAEDSDPAATPVAPRDLGLPAPAAGDDSAVAVPAEAIPRPEEMVSETVVPEEPAVTPSGAGLKKRVPAPRKPAIPASATEAVQLTIRVGKDGPKESFLISLRPDLAPQTVAAFKQNIESGFYEGLAFHRLIRNYIIQTGDPLSKDDAQKERWGTTDSGRNIPGEFVGSHVRYAVAMAHKAGEVDSSGSQFFITLRPATSLDGSYSVFGEVTQGMEVLNRLSGSVVDTNDTPVKRIEIVNAKLVRGDTKLTDSTLQGGRRKTKPDSQKGRLEKFIERIW